MFLLLLNLLASTLSFSYAVTLPGRRSSLDSKPNGNTSVSTTLIGGKISHPVSGLNLADYTVTCNPAYGAGLEARSCFDALSFAPRGEQQETFVQSGAVPPGIHNAVHLPIFIFSSKSSIFSSRGITPVITISARLNLLYRRYFMWHQPNTGSQPKCCSCERA